MNNQCFEHFLLTCFNIKRVSVAEGFDNPEIESKRNSLSYLDYRFDLFESITFPSVFHQCCQNFSWLVFFDQDTPEKYKQKNSMLQKKYTGFNPIYIKNDQEIATIIKQRLKQNTKYLVTTNLDNDDAISSDFIQVIQSNLKQNDLYLLNLPIGLMLLKEGLFLREYLSSPFKILVEKIDHNIITCLRFPHHFVFQLGQKGISVYQIATKPAWLQIVHQTNVRNKRDVNSVPIFNFSVLKNFNLRDLSMVKNKSDKNEENFISFYSYILKKKKRTLSFKMKLGLYTLFPNIAVWYNQIKFMLLQSNNSSKIIDKEVFLKTIENLENSLKTRNT